MERAAYVAEELERVMVASVPHVPRRITLDDLRHRLSDVMDSALGWAKKSGDTRILEQALKLTRYTYESEFKPAANEGKMDRKLCDDIGRALEKMESGLAAIKAKRGL